MFDRTKITGPLGLSIVSLAVVAVVLLMSMLPMISVLIGSSLPENDQTQERVDNIVLEFNDHQNTYQARFNGRSLFFKPPNWPPPPKAPALHVVVTPTTDAEDVKPPPPPPPPSTYTGPKIAFALSNEVWFKNGSKTIGVKVGEDHKGATVINTDSLPWTVRISYHGWEGEVDVFTTKKLSSDAIIPESEATDRITPEPTHPGIIPEPKPVQEASIPEKSEIRPDQTALADREEE